MTLKDIISAGGVVLLLSLIQISPLKINPWSAIAKGIRMAIGVEELTQRIEQLDEDIDTRIKNLDIKYAKSDFYEMRKDILNYARQIKKGEDHSENERRDILETITRYEKLCENYNFKNGQVEEEIEMIRRKKYSFHQHRKLFNF